MYRLNFRTFVLPGILFVIALNGCETERSNTFDTAINLYRENDGSPVIKDLTLKGVIGDGSGGFIVVFDEEGRERLERATNMPENHHQKLFVLAGDFRIGSVTNFTGLASGFIYVDGANKRFSSLCIDAGVLVVVAPEVPFTYAEALDILSGED